MDGFIDIVWDLLPFLLLIVFPILRGLNNHKKEKTEHKEKTRKVNYYKRKEDPPKLWKNIRKELKKELNKDKDSKNIQEVENFGKTILDKNINKNDKNPSLESQQTDTSKEKILDNNIKRENMEFTDSINSDFNKKIDISIHTNEREKTLDSLEFSSNSLLQGIIFSEILGQPKARRNQLNKNS